MYTPYFYATLWSRPYIFSLNAKQPMEWELTMLESYRNELEYEREGINREIEDIEAHIEEVANLIEEGAENTKSIYSAPTWCGPPPIGVAISSERELSMLESLEKDLSFQVEQIKRRLKELGMEDKQ